jgi:carbonic anhydrase
LANTVNELLRSSRIISDAVAAQRLGIVGCQYRLAEGHAAPITAVGPLDIVLSDEHL